MSARRADAGALASAARWTLVTCVLGFVGLGLCWALDRARTWETPRWEPRRFAALRGGAVPVPGPRGLVVVAVNTGCPHCLETLAAMADSLESPRAAGRSPRLVALVVDAAGRPGARELAPVRARSVVWDSSGTWRHRWGRRLYGDVLRFDPGGRWIGGASGPGDPRDTEGGEDS